MEPRRRNWIRATLFIGLAGATLWAWLHVAEGIRLRPAEASGPVDAPRLVDTDGAAVDFDAFEGRVVIVNMWASWCQPCRLEIPRLNRLLHDYRDDGLVVLGINVEALTAERMSAVRRELSIDYPVVIPLDLLEGTSFEGQGVVPHTWMIDRAGRIRASRSGLISERSLRRAIDTLLDE